MPGRWNRQRVVGARLCLVEAHCLRKKGLRGGCAAAMEKEWCFAAIPLKGGMSTTLLPLSDGARALAHLAILDAQNPSRKLLAKSLEDSPIGLPVCSSG